MEAAVSKRYFGSLMRYRARIRPIQAPVPRTIAGHAGAQSIAGCAYIIMKAIPAMTRPIAISVNSVPETIALSIGGPE